MPEGRMLPRAMSALPLPGLGDRPIYSHSWLGYGLDTAFSKAQNPEYLGRVGAPNPCLPTG